MDKNQAKQHYLLILIGFLLEMMSMAGLKMEYLILRVAVMQR